MCSICGGTSWDSLSEYIWEKCKDRGRDDAGLFVDPYTGYWIGNRRATPTTENQYPAERQPVGKEVKLVFNGIISNDKNLGLNEEEADSSVLPRCLDFSSIENFYHSVNDKIIGSYAIAVLPSDGADIWLAINYKPLWILEWNNNFYFSSLRQHFPEGLTPIRMTPYSVQSLINSKSFKIPRKQSDKALVICSSGLDSTTVAAYASNIHGYDKTTLLHFDYGCQATSKELEFVNKISNYLGTDLKIIKMSTFGGSSLLESDGEIVSGIEGAEYAYEWVPARNLMMLAHAVAFAEAKGYGYIYLGTNLEESGAYPDNEEQFINDFNNLLYGAVQNGIKIEIKTPLGGFMKHEIIPFGMKYNTPYELTWSCYRGGEKHCGQCGPCYMRKTAFERNGLEDPVFYED